MSRTHQHNHVKRILICLLAFACLFTSRGFAVSAAETTTITIPIEQIFQTTDYMLSRKDKTFEYCLTPVESTNPMPDGSTEAGYAVTLIGNDDTKQIQIIYTRVGDYHYRFAQKIEEQKAGYIYDENVYDIAVHVKYSNDNRLISETVVKNTDGMKVGTMSFQNEYDDSLLADAADGDTATFAAGAGTTDAAGQANANANPAAVQNTDDAQGDNLEQLDEEAAPRGMRNLDAWAVSNLILAGITVIGAVALLITYLQKKKKAQEKQDENGELKLEIDLKVPFRIAGVILAIASVGFFILTEDVTLPTRAADQYTWIMAVGCVAEVADMIYIKIKSKIE